MLASRIRGASQYRFQITTILIVGTPKPVPFKKPPPALGHAGVQRRTAARISHDGIGAMRQQLASISSKVLGGSGRPSLSGLIRGDK